MRWKEPRLILLPNPGKDPKLPNAYKPIKILPVLNKVWEKVLKIADGEIHEYGPDS